METSSASSREGEGSSSRHQQQQQQLLLHGSQQQRRPGGGSSAGGSSSPGLLATLRSRVWRSAVQGLGRKRGRSKQGSGSEDRSAHTSRRRRSSLMYGVMVIDMGVHQLSGLVQKINLTQVRTGVG